MSNDADSDGFDLTSAVQSGVDAVRTYLTPYGTEREAHVCPACQTGCEPTHTYDPDRAAFDGGASPAWVCPDCGSEYVRERDDGPPAVDLYGRE